MAPGIDGLPAAEREVDVSGPVARFVAELPPRGVSRLKLGLRVFELLPFPWRFSRLDLEAREDFLARMEGSRFGPHHDLLLMAKVLCTLGYSIVPEVRERVGYGSPAGSPTAPCPSPPGRWATSGPPRRRDMRRGDRRLRRRGAAAAATLAEAGLDVVVLEAGGHYDRDSYPSDPLDAIAGLYRDAGLTVAEGRPPVPVPVAGRSAAPR